MACPWWLHNVSRSHQGREASYLDAVYGSGITGGHLRQQVKGMPIDGAGIV